MRKLSLFIPLLVLFMTFEVSLAEDEKGAQDGMEVIKVSDGYTVIVPKGAKVKQKDGQIIVEDTTTVLLRRLNELEKQIATLTATIESLKEQLEKFNQETSLRFQMMELRRNPSNQTEIKE